MLEEIQTRLDWSPFKPFSIRLADSRFFLIESPDWVWLPESGLVHIWHPDDDFSECINPDLIISVSGEQNWGTE